MKSKANKITNILVFISVIFALASLKLIEKNNNSKNLYLIYIITEICYTIAIVMIVRHFILKNEIKNIETFEKIKQTNYEIEESKLRYDIVAKATSDTIWDWKINKNEFTWNKGIFTVFGYKKEDVETNSKWWFERIHPEDSIKMSVKLYSFLEHKIQKWQDEYRFKCQDGSYKFVLDRGFLVLDENGEPSRMIGAMQDITNQKKEEQRLKLLETVITNTKDAIVITDADISEFKIPKIVFVNQAFTNMSGYEYKDVIGKSPVFFYGDRFTNPELVRLVKCIEEKIECNTETLSVKKNGEAYWVRFSVIPVYNSDNEHSHWISIQRDVSEQKKQEKEKEQLINELTQNNKDLRQFSYITSHNLRAPLSNLIGLLKLVEEIPIENKELISIIDGFSKSTNFLNETISDLSKVVIIRDNLSIEKENISLADSLKNTISQIGTLMTYSNPKFITDIDENQVIYTNKAYFESILLNLLSNSIKYRSADRELKVSISTIKDEDFTSLIFEDNGIGIDLEKYKEKIFGLYQRFHNYPNSKGLGLYLVKSLIEGMGGAITVESEVDRGTKFILRFKNKK